MTFRTVPRGVFRALSVVTLRSAPFWEQSRKRRAARVALQGLYAYLAILLVLVALEDRLLFCPQGADSWADPPAGLAVQEVELAGADGTRLDAWWATPKGWEPRQGAVLFCHGNGGNLSHRRGALRPWLEEMHQAVLLFDYPGYGRSGGSPSEAGCYAAGDAAYDWLVGVQKVPLGRVLLYGGSLGGGVATDLASRRPHRALVLVSTFTSFPDMAQKQYPWLPGRWLVHNQFNNLAKIPACRGPVFIAHDPEDWLVPYPQGERLFAAAGEPKRFFVMHHQGHNDSPSAETFPALRRFLAEVEGRPEAD
jgi:pimeloyl-ACP methyl ester carboxylesterase